MTEFPPDWTLQESHLVRTFVFNSFPAAIAFMVEISFFCQQTDHHPEWKNIYNRVFVKLATHDAGRVTEKDVVLAEHMNKIYGQRAGG